MKTPLTLLGLLLLSSDMLSATFNGLGDLPGGIFNSGAYDVSNDGFVVIGISRSASGLEAFRWTLDGEIIGLGNLTGGNFDSMAFAISGDGSTIVGSGTVPEGREAFRWTVESGMVGLGDLDGGSFSSEAHDVSSDGSVIVGSGLTVPSAENGFGGSQAAVWTNNGGAVSIGGAYGSAVSQNGLTIVGQTHGNEAFRWRLTTGIMGIGDLPGGPFSSEAHSISPDGTVIVGQSFYGSGTGNGSQAFRWSEATGMVGLSDLPGGNFYSNAWDQSESGRYVVGAGKSSSGDEAFIWDQVNGMRDLRAKVQVPIHSPATYSNLTPKCFSILERLNLQLCPIFRAPGIFPWLTSLYAARLVKRSSTATSSIVRISGIPPVLI